MCLLPSLFLLALLTAKLHGHPVAFPSLLLSHLCQTPALLTSRPQALLSSSPSLSSLSEPESEVLTFSCTNYFNYLLIYSFISGFFWFSISYRYQIIFPKPISGPAILQSRNHQELVHCLLRAVEFKNNLLFLLKCPISPPSLQPHLQAPASHLAQGRNRVQNWW